MEWISFFAYVVFSGVGAVSSGPSGLLAPPPKPARAQAPAPASAHPQHASSLRKLCLGSELWAWGNFAVEGMDIPAVPAFGPFFCAYRTDFHVAFTSQLAAEHSVK